MGAYEARYTPNLAYAQFAGPLASAIATVSTVVMLAAIVLVAWLYDEPQAATDDFVNAAAATVVAIVTFAKVLSPQYLIWMVALVAAALRGAEGRTSPALHPRADAGLGAGPVRQLQSIDWVTWVLLARNLLLVGLFVISLASPPRRRRTRSATNIPTTSRSRAPRAILLDRDRTASRSGGTRAGSARAPTASSVLDTPPARATSGTSQIKYCGEKTLPKATNPATAAANA